MRGLALVVLLGSVLAACGPADRQPETPRAILPAGARAELLFAAIVGGSREDQFRDVRFAPDGSIVAAGYTRSPAGDLPDATRLGPLGGNMDALVARFAPDGRLLWLTLVGGSGRDYVTGFDLDARGDVLLAGGTGSPDFPTTPGAVQRTYAGGQGGEYGDAWAARLGGETGRLEWASFLGGRRDEAARGGAQVDAAGGVHVFGFTRSHDFLASTGVRAVAPIGGWSDMFWLRLAPDGARVQAARTLGSPHDDRPEELTRGAVFEGAGPSPEALVVVGILRGPGAPVAPPGAAAYGGGDSDVYLARLAAADGALRAARHLGGSGDDYAQRPLAPMPGTAGLFVTGSSSSLDLVACGPGRPASNRGGPFDNFLARLDADLELEFLTFFGGSGEEGSHGSALDPEAKLLILYGTTGSQDLPVTAGAASLSRQGERDAYFALFDSVTGVPLLATYFGGSSWERGSGVAARGGLVAAVGGTSSPDFPASEGAYQATRRGGRDATLVLMRVERTEPFDRWEPSQRIGGGVAARPRGEGDVPCPKRQ